MKTRLTPIVLFAVVGIVFCSNHLVAQITTNTYSDVGLLSNALQRVRSNASMRHLTTKDREWLSNIMGQWSGPAPWPEPSRKGPIMQNCATVLRSAIDTNMVETARREIRSESEVAAIRRLSAEVIAYLDMFSKLLLSPDLHTYLGAGYCAEIRTSTNTCRFIFWPESALQGVVVRQVECKAPGMLVQARFYESGRLMAFMRNRDAQIVFNEDGTLQYFWEKPEHPTP